MEKAYPTCGETELSALTAEGVSRNIKAQVCSVQQGLLSVKKMVEAGHRVVFDPKGSYIEDVRTQEHMSLKEKNGMFFITLWTKGSKKVFEGRAWRQCQP